MMGGDQVRGPEPGAQRRARAVHHRPRGHRCLPGALDALPQMTTREHPRVGPAAARTGKPVGPARRRQVLQTRRLGREPLLELHDRAREIWPAHRRTVEPAPDGTGYASPRYFRDRGWRQATLIGRENRTELTDGTTSCRASQVGVPSRSRTSLRSVTPTVGSNHNNAKARKARAFEVGDTGLEPVTSALSRRRSPN